RLISVADMISSSFVSGFRTQNIESVYFDFGLRRQSLLVCRHASRATELHVPVALNIEAEFFTAMIAAHSPDCPRTASRRQYERKMGAHHTHPPASARPSSTLDLRLVNPLTCFQIEMVRGRCLKSTYSRSRSPPTSTTRHLVDLFRMVFTQLTQTMSTKEQTNNKQN